MTSCDPVHYVTTPPRRNRTPVEESKAADLQNPLSSVSSHELTTSNKVQPFSFVASMEDILDSMQLVCRPEPMNKDTTQDTEILNHSMMEEDDDDVQASRRTRSSKSLQKLQSTSSQARRQDVGNQGVATAKKCRVWPFGRKKKASKDASRQYVHEKEDTTLDQQQSVHMIRVHRVPTAYLK